jgi:hypothetical protein
MLNYGSFMEMNAIIQKHDWWIKILKNNNQNEKKNVDLLFSEHGLPFVELNKKH